MLFNLNNLNHFCYRLVALLPMKLIVELHELSLSGYSLICYRDQIIIVFEKCFFLNIWPLLFLDLASLKPHLKDFRSSNPPLFFLQWIPLNSLRALSKRSYSCSFDLIVVYGHHISLKIFCQMKRLVMRNNLCFPF